MRRAVGFWPPYVYGAKPRKVPLSGGVLPRGDGTEGSLGLWLRARLFGWLSPGGASVAWALSWTLLWFGAVEFANRVRRRRAR